MPKIKSPETFVPNTVLTAAANQNHVDGAYPLPGFITEHPSLSVANTLANDDKLLISDTSDSAILKKANVSEILNSGLAITTGSITGKTAVDLVITPAVGQKVDVAGSFEADSINSTGNSTVGGNHTVSGTNTSNGAAIFNGSATFNGSVNFTGSLTGSFIGFVEENIPNASGVAANTLHNLFTSASYTKPANEVWVVEVDAVMQFANNNKIHYRITNSADNVNYAISYMYSAIGDDVIPIFNRFILNSANTHTGTFVFRAKAAGANITISPNSTQLAGYPDGANGSIGKFRIYKYKV